MLRRIKQRLQREWEGYQRDPEVSLGRLYRGVRGAAGKHIFRSLVQVNLYPAAKFDRK